MKMQLKESVCRACNQPVLLGKTSANKWISLVPDPVRIIKDVTGDSYLRPDGTYIFGKEVGDSYDGEDAIEVYILHPGVCPNGGKVPRKPRNRVASDIRRGYFADIVAQEKAKAEGTSPDECDAPVESDFY